MLQTREKRMSTCYLIGAAPEARRVAPKPGDILIAADGGLDHTLRWGLTPDLLVGDFDSVQGRLPQGVPCRQFPREKDETDMEIALKAGLEEGYRHFVFSGASGGRADHTLANLQLLVKAAKAGATAVLYAADGRTAWTAVIAGQRLHMEGNGAVSVFAYGEKAEGVDISGLKYEMRGGVLFGDTPRGISNLLENGQGCVRVQKGVLWVLWATPGVNAVWSPNRDE
jgi:thiamine pyrophosphokinase